MFAGTPILGWAAECVAPLHTGVEIPIRDDEDAAAIAARIRQAVSRSAPAPRGAGASP